MRMGLPYRAEPPIIRTWALEVGGYSFPRGGMGRVREVLREHGHSWKVADARTDGDPKLGSPPEHLRDLWPHQGEALEAFVARQQGILRAPTASGKTTIGFAAAARLGVPTLVIVDGRPLLKQWVRRAGEEFGMRERDVGIVQGPRCVVKALTIGMAQSVGKRAAELAGRFGLVVFDEVQMAAAPTFMAAVDPIRARYRLGISADERRKDGKEFLIRDVFGDVVHEIKRQELERKGVVLEVDVRVVPTEFRADWYGLADEADEDDDRDLDFDRLLKEMARDEGRNRLAVDIVEREASAGERVLVMAHQREHCLELSSELQARRVRAGFLIGGDDYRAEFQRTATSLLAGKISAGVGTLKAIGKGIDMPAVGRAVVVTPIAGNKQFSGQVRGRICRAPPGKRDAVMYVLWDQHCSFGRKHLRNLCAWNRAVTVLEGGRWVDARDYMRRCDRAA